MDAVLVKHNRILEANRNEQGMYLARTGYKCSKGFDMLDFGVSYNLLETLQEKDHFPAWRLTSFTVSLHPEQLLDAFRNHEDVTKRLVKQ